jgi:hypothetical protein
LGRSASGKKKVHFKNRRLLCEFVRDVVWPICVSYLAGNFITIPVVTNVSRVVLHIIGHNLLHVVKTAELLQILAISEHRGLNCV